MGKRNFVTKRNRVNTSACVDTFFVVQLFSFQMSGLQPLQFEPNYSPRKEPSESESEEESERGAESSNFNARVRNTEWCPCGGNCAAMSTADKCFCYQEMDALNKKFGQTRIECITNHSKFRIVCPETDVLLTTLVAIKNARCNPLSDPMENRLVVGPNQLLKICLFTVSPADFLCFRIW